MKIKLYIVLIVFLFFQHLAFATPKETPATIGNKAPAFTLTDTEGNAHSLADYTGKIVILEWHNPKCPFVVKHYASNNMQNLQKNYTTKDVVWLTINSSAPNKQGNVNPEEAKKYLDINNATPTAYLLDTTGSVGKSYGARTTPHMYIIDKEGTLVYAGAIDSNDSAREASIKNAENYISKALDELIEGSNVSLARTEPYGCSVKYAS